MADFHQTGVVTTLHRLKPNNIERLEADLEKFSRNRPIGLVLPALYSEFETVAMQKIVSELKRVRYLQRIVLVLEERPRSNMYAPAHFSKTFTRRSRRFGSRANESRICCGCWKGAGYRQGVTARAVPAGWLTAIFWRRGIAT